MKSRPRAQPDAAARQSVEWPPSAETLKRVEVLWLGQDPPPAEVEDAFTVVRPADVSGPPPPRTTPPPVEAAPVAHAIPPPDSGSPLAREDSSPQPAAPPRQFFDPADREFFDPVPDDRAPSTPAEEESASFFIERPPALADPPPTARRPRPPRRRHRPASVRPKRWPVYLAATGALVAAVLIAMPAVWRQEMAPARVTLSTADTAARPGAEPAGAGASERSAADVPDASAARPGADLGGDEMNPSPGGAAAVPERAGVPRDGRPAAQPAPPAPVASAPEPQPERLQATAAMRLPVLAPASQVTPPARVTGGGRSFGMQTLDVAAVSGIPAAPAATTPPASPRPGADTTAPAPPRPAAETAANSRSGDIAAEVTASAEQGVREALSLYRSGYEELDVGMVREAWPGVDTQALARAFSGLSSQDLVFDRCDILIRGEAARARCAGSNTYVRRVGSRAPRTVPLKWAFDLSRAGNHWTITNAAVQ